MSQNQIAGLMGAVFLFSGLFTPIFTSPVKGQISYFHYNQTEAAIVLALATLALTLSLVRRYKALLFTGLGVCATLGLAFVKFLLYTTGQDTRWMSKFSDSPFEGINRLTQQTFALDWGWGLLLVGAVLVVAASRLRGYERSDN